MKKRQATAPMGQMDRRDFLRLAALGAAGLSVSSSFAGPWAAFAATSETDKLAYLSVAEQIKLFKAGTLSPVDVLEAQIARIRKYNGPLNVTGEEIKEFMAANGQVNAITYEHFDQARKAAKEAEARYKAGTARALEGVTVAVKDEHSVIGWRVTMGAVAQKDAPLCDKNSAIIDMLLSQGAILHIQTTVPELYLHTQTWSRLWGVTRNPWNLHYAAGGSSGGSGAALAAGFTTLATGSDMGGSIRLPSSLCGLYGFKAPFGRVATSEISFETNGPMARSFDDMVMMQNAIAGPHPTVHASLRPKLEYPHTYGSLKGVKIALDYFGGWIPEGIDNAVRQSLSQAADVLRAQGATVTEVDLGWKYADIVPVMVDGLFSTAMGDMVLQAKEYVDSATSYTRNLVAQMKAKGPAEMARSDELVTRLHQQLQKDVFGQGCSALIMPTLATPYFPADNDPITDTVPVNGKPVKSIYHTMTAVWNLLSRYPILDVPVGVAPNNVPMGMQVVGNTFDDLAACQVAYGYSQGNGLKLYQGALFPDYRNKA